MTDFSNLIPMVSIPAGEFLMGSPPDEEGHFADEGPQHEVTLESFLMGRTPITQAQWRVVAEELPMVMGVLNPDPSLFKGDDRPVEKVSWFDAVEFCARLSQATGRHYCLPSEAQWEYACRAGTTTPFPFGETISPKLANYDGTYSYANGPKGEYRQQTTPVGSFPANAWGLQDMNGNVWEWCLDQWHDSYHGAPTDGSAWMEVDDCLGKSLGASFAAAPGSGYPTSAARPAVAAITRPSSANSLGSASAADCLGKTPGAASCAAAPASAYPTSAARPAGAAPPRASSAYSLGSASVAQDERILRGGSWFNDPRDCRSASRSWYRPVVHDQGRGFRVCCLSQPRSIFTRVTSMTDFSNLIPMVEIPAGSFLMGSPPDEEGHFDDEGPQHQVTLESFLMGRTPITQAQWLVVAQLPMVMLDLNPDPSYFKGANKPVDRVSWHEAVEFCRRLSRATGRHYCLPSEAQWEYACRAGTTTPFAFGDTLSANQANFNSHSTSEVGSFPANRWGLYDMHGNVWEWCKDQWHDSYNGAPTDGSAWMEVDDCLGKTPGAASCAAAPASTSPTSAALPSGSATARPSSVTELGSASRGGDRLGKCSEADPGPADTASAARLSGSAATARSSSMSALGFASRVNRLLRGGSWIDGPPSCRSAYRDRDHPDSLNQGMGFRVCCLPRT